MTFDELQEKWQSQQRGFTLTIDSDMLLKEIKRNKKYFESVVYSRDIREAGVAIAMFLFFGYVGLQDNFWPSLLLALLVLFIAVFLIADRIVQKRKRPKTSQSLSGCIQASLHEVNHQIWLLKNVFWWYLLPPFAGMAIFVGYVAWDARDHLGWFMFDITSMVAVILLVWFIYRLNQKAVREDLFPLKQELEDLLSSLEDVSE